MSLRPFLVDLLELLAPHRRLVAAVVVGLLIDVAFQTALPLSLKFLIDEAIVPRDSGRLGLFVGLLVVGLALACGAMIWRDRLYARLGAQVMRDVRARVFAHLQSLSLSFFGSVRPGDLLARFSTDLASVEALVVGALPNVFGAVLSVAVLSIALFALSWELALVVLVLAPLCWIGPRVLLPRAARLGLEARRQEAAVLSLVQENIESQNAVKALGLEAYSIDQARERLDEAARGAQRFNFASYLAERIPNAGMLVLHVLVLIAGAALAFEDHLSVGALVAFNGVLLTLGAAVATLTSSAHTFLNAAAGLRRVREVLDERPEVNDVPQADTMPPMLKDLVFEQVCFSPRGTPILRGVDLHVRRGESVALVGPSGSGKSTVLSLIARFRDPTTGTIRVDGVDLRQYRQSSLRARLGIVPQDTVLFEGTLRDNIRLARLDASDAEVEVAARMAEVDTFASLLPQRYDTHLGAGGARLSGGQRQRVAIARVLLRSPELLLLDEATSALDPATERAINATLRALRERFTVLRVTHRLTEAAECDRVVVLDGGRVVEEGTHAQLVSKADGLYARMWRRQQGLQLSDNGEHAAVTATWLAEWPLFEGADPVLLEEVSRAFLTERVLPGSEIIRQGAPGDRFYILVRGAVAVSRGTGGGEAIEIALLREGDAFGETALLSDEPRNATVTAITECVLLSLERARFLPWADRDPAWRKRLDALVAGRRGRPTWG
ncbi:MAG: ATP-binding cassette protein [Panacagrimonas sp.]|jgi:ATP-binding cassette subfamily B protein|nr:ABC transporter transmembrane domain-containing protein [Panacagrimonas sp.]MCC2658597.1 ATP-binding cassette protein [Panacagrimonas sp.]